MEDRYVPQQTLLAGASGSAAEVLRGPANLPAG